MENQKNIFEEELVNAIKKIEAFLQPEEKENLYQKALAISKEEKALKSLRENLDKIKNIYGNAVSEYNKRIVKNDKEIVEYNNLIDSIEKRLIKESECKPKTPNLDAYNKKHIDKLDTETLAELIKNIFEGYFEQ